MLIYNKSCESLKKAKREWFMSLNGQEEIVGFYRGR